VNIEDYPEISTMGVAWDPAGAIAWGYQPTQTGGWVELAGGAPPVVSMGTGTPCTQGDVLAAGYWVITFDNSGTPVSVFRNSPGTTTCPATGTKYPITLA